MSTDSNFISPQIILDGCSVFLHDVVDSLMDNIRKRLSLDTNSEATVQSIPNPVLETISEVKPKKRVKSIEAVPKAKVKHKHKSPLNVATEMSPENRERMLLHVLDNPEKWVEQSIATAQLTLVTSKCVSPRNIRQTGREIKDGVFVQRNSSGTWVAHFTPTGRLMAMRLWIRDMRESVANDISSRVYWRRRERQGKLAVSTLRFWYLCGALSSSSAVKDVTNNPERYGLQVVHAGQVVRFKVTDENLFRRRLQSDFDISHLPGDKGWWKSEFRRGSKKKDLYRYGVVKDV